MKVRIIIPIDFRNTEDPTRPVRLVVDGLIDVPDNCDLVPSETITAGGVTSLCRLQIAAVEKFLNKGILEYRVHITNFDFENLPKKQEYLETFFLEMKALFSEDSELTWTWDSNEDLKVAWGEFPEYADPYGE